MENKTMTPEEQQIAIAQASQGAIEFYEGVWRYFDGKRLHPCKDNDPLQDLNAMHEAEKVLRPIRQVRYHDLLRAKLGSYDLCSHATAAQRAEAFLKTLNLWKE